MEESIRFLRSDYEKQIEQQMQDQQMLQAELESMKNHNAGLAQEEAKIKSDISEAMNVLS